MGARPYHPLDRSIGLASRARRRLLELSQEEVADAMRLLGHPTWTRATVSEVERGGRTVGVSELVGLANALHASPRDLCPEVAYDGGSVA